MKLKKIKNRWGIENAGFEHAYDLRSWNSFEPEKSKRKWVANQVKSSRLCLLGLLSFAYINEVEHIYDKNKRRNTKYQNKTAQEINNCSDKPKHILDSIYTHKYWKNILKKIEM